MRAFKIVVDDVLYQGAWLAHPDDTVEVRSDYGDARVPVRGRVPADLARSILTRMVEKRREGLR